jgi:hypothetical protein
MGIFDRLETEEEKAHQARHRNHVDFNGLDHQTPIKPEPFEPAEAPPASEPTKARKKADQSKKKEKKS